MVHTPGQFTGVVHILIQTKDRVLSWYNLWRRCGQVIRALAPGAEGPGFKELVCGLFLKTPSVHITENGFAAFFRGGG